MLDNYLYNSERQFNSLIEWLSIIRIFVVLKISLLKGCSGNYAGDGPSKAEIYTEQCLATHGFCINLNDTHKQRPITISMVRPLTLRHNIGVGDVITKINDKSTISMTPQQVVKYLLQFPVDNLQTLQTRTMSNIHTEQCLAAHGFSINLNNTRKGRPISVNMILETALKHNIIVGDVIVKINDQHTNHMTPKQVLKYLIKMSSIHVETERSRYIETRPTFTSVIQINVTDVERTLEVLGDNSLANLALYKNGFCCNDFKRGEDVTISRINSTRLKHPIFIGKYCFH